MDTGINISSEGVQETIVLMAAAIDTVFESAFRNHVSAEVQLQALEALKAAGSVNDTTITNCHIVGKQVS